MWEEVAARALGAEHRARVCPKPGTSGIGLLMQPQCLFVYNFSTGLNRYPEPYFLSPGRNH